MGPGASAALAWGGKSWQVVLEATDTEEHAGVSSGVVAEAFDMLIVPSSDSVDVLRRKRRASASLRLSAMRASCSSLSCCQSLLLAHFVTAGAEVETAAAAIDARGTDEL